MLCLQCLVVYKCVTANTHFLSFYSEKDITAVRTYVLKGRADPNTSLLELCRKFRLGHTRPEYQLFFLAFFVVFTFFVFERRFFLETFQLNLIQYPAQFIDVPSTESSSCGLKMLGKHYTSALNIHRLLDVIIVPQEIQDYNLHSINLILCITSNPKIYEYVCSFYTNTVLFYTQNQNIRNSRTKVLWILKDHCIFSLRISIGNGHEYILVVPPSCISFGCTCIPLISLHFSIQH